MSVTRTRALPTVVEPLQVIPSSLRVNLLSSRFWGNQSIALLFVLRDKNDMTRYSNGGFKPETTSAYLGRSQKTRI